MQTSNPSIKRLFSVITFILVFLVFSRTVVDADLWWHLRTGQNMWEQQKILLNDSFSYTRFGAAWVNAFWLSEIALYLCYRIGGYFAIALFVALTGALTFYLIYNRLPGSPILNSFIILLTAITAAPIWGPRPQILSFLLVAILDRWLDKRENHPAWMLIPLFALWANLHGGWIWGLLLLFAHIAGDVINLLSAPSEQKTALWQKTKNLLGWSALAMLAIGLNPNGLAIWRLPFEQVNVSMQIQEWLSPDFHRIDFHPFLWILFLLLLVAPLAGKYNWQRLFKVLGFAYLTFVAQRNIALFAIVSAPLLSDWLNTAAQPLWKENRFAPRSSLNPHLTRWFNALILICLSLASIGYLYTVSQASQVEKHYPVQAIQWIKDNHPEGRLFNSYNWGGYLLWSLPNYPVFIDGRADLYGPNLIGQWQDVVQARKNAFSILDDWNVNIILLEPDWPVISLLENDGWRVLYHDEISVLLSRP